MKPWWDEISDGAKNCVGRLLTVDPKRGTQLTSFARPLDAKLLSQQPQIPIPVTNQYPPATKVAHPIQVANNRYSKKFRSTNSDLYSPAAVALRDAFDISTAVHRMGEEAALQTKSKPQLKV